jgi:hypothetical protein
MMNAAKKASQILLLLIFVFSKSSQSKEPYFRHNTKNSPYGRNYASYNGKQTDESYLRNVYEEKNYDEFSDSWRENPPQFSSKIGNGESCSYSSLLTAASHQDPSTWDSFFSIIENHEFYHPNLIRTGEELDSRPCPNKCNNKSINSIYESLIVKHLLKNEDATKKMASVMKKVLQSLSEKMGNDGFSFQESISNWIPIDDIFPVIQKKTILYPFSEKDQDFKRILLNLDSPLLQFDYFMSIYKAKRNGFYIKSRNRFFNQIGRRLRGYRSNKEEDRSEFNSQIGIAKFDSPLLEASPNEGYSSWKHWGRHNCIVDEKKSIYSRSATQFGIPLACGLSGTTNIALWGLLSNQVDLTVEEFRVFLLTIWTILCADGGHSLQEVLSMSKILSIYLGEFMIEHPELQDRFSLKTIQSLEKVTQGIRPLGPTGPKIELDHEEKCSKIHEKMFNPRSPYAKIEAPERLESSPEEQIIRNEIEYYYFNCTKDDNKKSQFSRYLDSFFKKINDHNDHSYFNTSKRAAQIELFIHNAHECSSF